jgi:hypothetical protein
MTSVVFQESVKIQGRTLTHILTLSFQKGLGATAAFVAQHTQKIPFCIELRGSSKFIDDFAEDQMYSHSRPLCPLAGAGIGDLAE